MAHEYIHLNPFVNGMYEAEACQGWQCPAQTHIGSSAALDRDQQPHAEKCQSIDKIDRNDIGDAQDHDVPRSAFEGFCPLLNPQPAATRPAEAVSGLSTGSALMTVCLPVLHLFAFMPPASARLTFTRLRRPPVGKQGNANQSQPKPANDPR